jgi:hypothetical protein
MDASRRHRTPENQVRSRLPAGGSEIRTLGLPAIATIVFRLNFPVRLRFRERPSRPNPARSATPYQCNAEDFTEMSR